MAPGNVRPLHWVFKVGDRTSTVAFLTGLGMKVLRHEEFEVGCEATCNGPYDGKWSKTMMGYGDEDKNFVLELTYNYGVKRYQLGNDFRHITIEDEALRGQLARQGLPEDSVDKVVTAVSPDGYKFRVAGPSGGNARSGPAIVELALNCSNLERSLGYWRDFLGFEVVTCDGGSALLVPAPGACCMLRLVQLPAQTLLEHGTGFGRVAFSCPAQDLQALESSCHSAGHAVITPYVSLDTPGKATVEVVILGDPDGFEICFVGDEGFRELSRTDPDALDLLEEAISRDRSKEWFAEDGRKRSFFKC